MDLLHLDFTKIEVSSDHEKELKRKPEIANVLVVTDHFTWHTIAFMTEDTTTHTMGPCFVLPLLLHLWHSTVPHDR